MSGSAHIVQGPDAHWAAFRRATANSQRGKKATQTQQEAILQAAKSLEGLNPTDSPATSPLINGRWSLLYQGRSACTQVEVPVPGVGSTWDGMLHSSMPVGPSWSSRTSHTVSLGCATGPEEATKRREPLEGPVIDFFRPILGFLFRTLVHIRNPQLSGLSVCYALNLASA